MQPQNKLKSCSSVLAIPVSLDGALVFNRAPYKVVFAPLSKTTTESDLLVQLPDPARYKTDVIDACYVIYYHVTGYDFHNVGDPPSWPGSVPPRVIEGIRKSLAPSLGLVPVGFENVGNSCFINAAVNLVAGIFQNSSSRKVGTRLDGAIVGLVSGSASFQSLRRGRFYRHSLVARSGGQTLESCVESIRDALAKNDRRDQGDAAEVIQLMLERAEGFEDTFASSQFTVLQNMYDTGVELRGLSCSLAGTVLTLTGQVLQDFQDIWKRLPPATRVVAMLGLRLTKVDGRDFFEACLMPHPAIPKELLSMCCESAVAVSRNADVPWPPPSLDHAEWRGAKEVGKDLVLTVTLDPGETHSTIGDLMQRYLAPEPVALLPENQEERPLFNHLFVRQIELLPSSYLFIAISKNKSASEKIKQTIQPDPQLQVGGSVWLLKGVVCHIGATAASGHYLSVTRVGEQGTWLVVDDNKAKIITNEAFQRRVGRDVCVALYENIHGGNS